MSQLSRRRAAQVAAAALTGAAAVAAAPASADAASFRNCNASILSGSLLGQQLPAVAASGGSGTCRVASGGVGQVLPAPLSAAAVRTATNVVPGQVAGGSATVADLGVGIPGGVLEQITAAIRAPLASGTAAINGQLNAITGPLGITADATPAVNALLTLPTDRNLVSAQAVESLSTATCVSGRPVLGSSSRIVGLRALGGTIDANSGAETAVNAVDTQNINLSQIDLSKITLKDANGNPVAPNVVNSLTATLQGVVGRVTAGIPPIQIPAQVLRLKVSAGQETKSAADVSRTALRVELGLAGQSVADISVARTTAGIDGNPCQAAAPVSAGEAQLQCDGRDISLIDASIRGSRVRFRGFVNQEYAAKHANKVRIKGEWFGKSPRVVTTRTAKNGTFSGQFRVSDLIRRRFRQGKDNDVRAYATVGRKRSALSLKLQRRMNTDSVRQLGNGKVRFRGRASSPRIGTRQRVEIRERLGCSKKERTVARGRLGSDGAFRVDVRKPSGDFAFYRAVTRVIATDKRTGRPNGKRVRTYTVLNPVTLSADR